VAAARDLHVVEASAFEGEEAQLALAARFVVLVGHFAEGAEGVDDLGVQDEGGGGGGDDEGDDGDDYGMGKGAVRRKRAARCRGGRGGETLPFQPSIWR